MNLRWRHHRQLAEVEALTVGLGEGVDVSEGLNELDLSLQPLIQSALQQILPVPLLELDPLQLKFHGSLVVQNM